MYKVIDTTGAGVLEHAHISSPTLAIKIARTCTQPTIVKEGCGWGGGSIVKWSGRSVEALSFPGGQVPWDAAVILKELSQ